MQNKIVLFVFTLLSINLYAVEFSFKDQPESFYKSEKGVKVSFKQKAAIYTYNDNEECDKAFTKALEQQLEVEVTVNAKTNQILKCD